jgi:hypothetical protein
MNATVLLIVTGVSVAIAVVMTIVAWRVSRRERERAEARIAALAAEIRGGSSMAVAGGSGGGRAEVAVRAEPPRRYPAAATNGPRSFLHDLPLRDVSTVAAGDARTQQLFTDVGSEPAGARIVAVAAFGIFIVAAAAALAIVLGGVFQSSQPPDVSRAGNGPAAAAATKPPELAGLTHERDGDRLTIKGVVRNPPSGSALSGLDAVVSVFDRDGSLMTTVRAAVERGPLVPGSDAPFVVSVPDAAAVGRYRLSFRIGDRTIAHVDRRARAEAGRDE